MGSRLPEITEEQFRSRLAASVPRLEPEALGIKEPGKEPVAEPEDAVSERVAADLYRHYLELVRWNPRVSLVGPGTAADLVRRHYGESLAALSLLRAEDRTLVDVGSGAGFPGLVLAVARRTLAVTLIEPRHKKWVFLKTVARKIGLSCQCLDVRLEARLGAGRVTELAAGLGADHDGRLGAGANGRGDGNLCAGLPNAIDVVTSRALKMPPGAFELLSRHSPRIRFLLWHGEGLPEIPEPLKIQRRWRLSGTRQRRILEIQADPATFDDDR